MDILYIIIPAYNEAENIGKVIEEWYPVVKKHSGGGRSRLVIIDDGSKDNTFEIMQDHTKNRPLFQPLTKPNGGHGATVLFGYHYALEHHADYIFQTDSDRQTIPEAFEPFWKHRKKADAIIGSRRHREDGFSRIVVTKVLKLVIRLIFGVSVQDANTPFRLMKRELLNRYIDKVPKDFFLTNVLLSVFFVKYHEKVIFHEITFRPRQGGVNSINLRRITKIGFQAVKDFVKIRKTMQKER